MEKRTYDIDGKQYHVPHLNMMQDSLLSGLLGESGAVDLLVRALLSGDEKELMKVDANAALLGIRDTGLLYRFCAIVLVPVNGKWDKAYHDNLSAIENTIAYNAESEMVLEVFQDFLSVKKPFWSKLKGSFRNLFGDVPNLPAVNRETKRAAKK